MAVQDRSHGGCAGACSAGKGLTGAAFPHPHGNGVTVQNFDEFGVYAVGKHGVMLEIGADVVQIQIVYVVTEDHGVGISHGHPCELICLPTHLDGERYSVRFRIFRENRDFSGGEDRCAHIDCDRYCFIVFGLDSDGLDAASGGDADFGLFRNIVVVNVFGHAAYAVSAHGAAGTVGVIHVHFAVRLAGRPDQDQPVRADSKMTVADLYGGTCRIGNGFLKTVYIYIIISDPLHFCKFHLLISPFRKKGAPFLQMSQTVL